MIRFMMPCLVSAVFVAGCSNKEAPTGNYSFRPAPSANRAATLDAAEAALVALGYTIAKRDVQAGVITTEPVREKREVERSIRADSPLRKIVEVRVSGPASSPKVQCKVLIQEQSNETFQLFSVEQGGDDVPGHRTAIDRDAATTAEQNTVWRTVRRDKSAEREILNQITNAEPEP